MSIYSFWSGDTTYFTNSKSLKKAQAVGKENMIHYFETCKYLEEEPEAGADYFIPKEVEKERIEWVRHMMKTDKDVMVLENDTEDYINLV